MKQMTVKTTSVFIATGDQTNVYRAVEDVPPAQWEEVVRRTTGKNAVTLFIADRHGQRELDKALRGLPSRLHARRALTPTVAAPKLAPEVEPRFPKVVAASLIVTGLGLLAWMLASFR